MEPGLQVREGMGAEGTSLKLSAKSAVIWLIAVNKYFDFIIEFHICESPIAESLHFIFISY